MSTPVLNQTYRPCCEAMIDRDRRCNRVAIENQRYCDVHLNVLDDNTQDKRRKRDQDEDLKLPEFRDILQHAAPTMLTSWGDCINIRRDSEYLGHGSYGTVYAVDFMKKVNHGETKRYNLAVKVMARCHEVDVKTEIASMFVMNSKGFGPTLYDWWRCERKDRKNGKCKWIYYILMERMHSGVGQPDFDSGKRYTPQDKTAMLNEAKRLDEAHIVHGDLKPDNMMRNADGAVRAVDFGFMKVFDDDIMMDFTAGHGVMGWTTTSQKKYIPYPNRWVQNINQLQLLSYLVDYEGTSENEYTDYIPADFENPTKVGNQTFADRFNAYIKRHGYITNCCTGDLYEPPPAPVGWCTGIMQVAARYPPNAVAAGMTDTLEAKEKAREYHTHPHECEGNKPDGQFRDVLITRLYPRTCQRVPLYLMLYDTGEEETWKNRWARGNTENQLSLHWCTGTIRPDYLPLLPEKGATRKATRWVKKAQASIEQWREAFDTPLDSYIEQWIGIS